MEGEVLLSVISSRNCLTRKTNAAVKLKYETRLELGWRTGCGVNMSVLRWLMTSMCLKSNYYDSIKGIKDNFNCNLSLSKDALNCFIFSVQTLFVLSISKIWDLLKMPCYGHLFCFLLWNLIPHKHSKVYFCAFLQEDLGHWELCVVHFTEKHARERPQEGRWIPHEAEPVAVWSQTERPDGGSSPDQLPGGAERPQVFWREIFRGHLDGRT